MKSIKEKAEENCLKYNNVSNVAYQEFVAGANYVLEQVDYILMDRDLDCEETCDSLFELIEQLKK